MSYNSCNAQQKKHAMHKTIDFFMEVYVMKDN